MPLCACSPESFLLTSLSFSGYLCPKVALFPGPLFFFCPEPFNIPQNFLKPFFGQSDCSFSISSCATFARTLLKPVRALASTFWRQLLEYPMAASSPKQWAEICHRENGTNPRQKVDARDTHLFAGQHVSTHDLKH